MSLSEVESATRCILYPDTTVCGLSSSSTTSSCQLVIREPASQVYLRTGELSSQSQSSTFPPVCHSWLFFQSDYRRLHLFPYRVKGYWRVLPWKQRWVLTGGGSFSSSACRTPAHQSERCASKQRSQRIGRGRGTPPNHGETVKGSRQLFRP